VRLHYTQVRKILKGLIGENGVKVLEVCRKSEVTDEQIMNKTGLQLNVIRSVLNQLHYQGLIGYNREKDVKTNWYTYTWFAREGKIKQLIAENWEDRLRELEEKLDRESNYVFFECPDKCEEKIPFEIAAEYDFKCSVCGKELKHVDNKQVIKETITEIKQLKSLMKKIDAK